MPRYAENTAEPNSWDDFAEVSATDRSGARAGFDLAMLYRRKWWLLLGLGAGLLLALMQYARNAPVYESHGQILIQEKVQATPFDATGLSSTPYDPATALNHAVVMASPKVVQKAVTDFGLAKLPSLATSGDVVASVGGGLRVAPLNNDEYSGIYTISYRGPNPEDGQEIIDALVETYGVFLGKADKNASAELVDYIKEAQTLLNDQIEKQTKSYLERYEESDYVLMKDGEFVNRHLEQQAQIDARRAELRLRLVEIRARLDSAQVALKHGTSADALLLALESQSGQLQQNVVRDPTALSLESLPSLEIELADLSSGYGPNHPKVKAVRRRIEILREIKSKVAEQRVTDDRQSESETVGDLLTVSLESLQQQLDTAEGELKLLDAMYAREQADAKRLGNALAVRQQELDRIEGSKQLFDALVENVEKFSLMDEAGGGRYRIDMLAAPGLGGKVAPRWTRFMSIGAALGLLAGAALAQFIERADQRFKSPDDIARTLRLPVVGHIPDVVRQKRQDLRFPHLASELVAAQYPQCPAAEAYRAVRTALYFGVHGKRHQVIQLTSPLPEDGKSTLIANLAISIAQSGKRVLLLDADLRRPVQHQKFGLPNDAGLADVVSGTAEPPNAMQQSAVENLWVMTAGQRPQNPAEVLTSPRFEELINLVRDQFDFVLVDTPPLLAVTDPSAVAPRVDAVLLVVRLGKNSRNGARTACGMLHDLGVEVVGVVVNRLDKRKHYGGYTNDAYTYGYGAGGNRYSPKAEDDELGSNGRDYAESVAGVKPQA